jgi:glucose-6-phosphate 1-dehydrogenase
MTASRSYLLVLFGVTGDLAHKMIFPALYAMAKRGTGRKTKTSTAIREEPLTDGRMRSSHATLESYDPIATTSLKAGIVPNHIQRGPAAAIGPTASSRRSRLRL